mgnify:CR=1 FL=1
MSDDDKRDASIRIVEYLLRTKQIKSFDRITDWNFDLQDDINEIINDTL